MWKKKPAEQLPWYRDPGYKGNMPEADKRKLDAIRMQPHHPATSYEELPEEAQGYINELEMNVHDLQGQSLMGRTIVSSGLGAFLLYITVYGFKPTDDLLTRLLLLAMIVVPWILYRRESKNISERLLPEEGSWYSADEQLRYNWELNYLSAERSRVKAEEDDS